MSAIIRCHGLSFPREFQLVASCNLRYRRKIFKNHGVSGWISLPSKRKRRYQKGLWQPNYSHEAPRTISRAMQTNQVNLPMISGNLACRRRLTTWSRPWLTMAASGYPSKKQHRMTKCRARCRRRAPLVMNKCKWWAHHRTPPRCESRKMLFGSPFYAGSASTSDRLWRNT